MRSDTGALERTASYAAPVGVVSVDRHRNCAPQACISPSQVCASLRVACFQVCTRWLTCTERNVDGELGEVRPFEDQRVVIDLFGVARIALGGPGHRRRAHDPNASPCGIKIAICFAYIADLDAANDGPARASLRGARCLAWHWARARLVCVRGAECATSSTALRTPTSLSDTRDAPVR